MITYPPLWDLAFFLGLALTHFPVAFAPLLLAHLVAFFLAVFP